MAHPCWPGLQGLNPRDQRVWTADFLRACSRPEISLLSVNYSLLGGADFQARMEAQRQAKIAAENTTDDAQCRNYGAAPGAQTYTECRMAIAMQRKNIEAAQDLQIQQNSATMMMTGAAIAAGR
jgi:hypothetical protein